jgi:hypothetical protein
MNTGIGGLKWDSFDNVALALVEPDGPPYTNPIQGFAKIKADWTRSGTCM